MAEKYSVHPSIIARKEQEGSLLFNKETEDIKVLNEVGSLIWGLCDGTMDASDIADILSSQYPTISKNVLQADVEKFLGILLSRKLVVTVEKEVTYG